MVKVILGSVVGAAIGGLIGYFTRCAGGGCPLMGNPIGGMIFGALIGFLFTYSMKENVQHIELSKNVVEIQNEAHFEQLLKTSNVFVVDFYAEWCGPCRRLKPVINELADYYQGKAVFAAVNIDANKDLAQKYDVSAIPDVRIFKNGAEIERIFGNSPKEKYSSVIDKLVGTP